MPEISTLQQVPASLKGRCGGCVFYDVDRTRDAKGHIQPRRVSQCHWERGIPILPSSVPEDEQKRIVSALTTQPYRAMMTPDDGEICPVRKDR